MIISRHTNFAAWYAWIIACCFLVHLVLPKLFPIALITLITLVIAGLVRKELAFKRNVVLALFTAFYLAYLVGCLFTQHPDLAANYLEYKLSFIVMPLLFSFRLKSDFSLKPIVYGLVAGNVVLAVMGGCNSAWLFSRSGLLLDSLTSSNFSFVHHPTYFAAMNVVALVAVWAAYYRRWKGFNAVTALSFTLLSIVVQVLCLSLAGLLFFTALVFVFAVHSVYRKWGKPAAFSVVLLLPGLLLIAFFSVPSIRQEVKAIRVSVGAYISDPNAWVLTKPSWKSGSEVRLVMWTVGAQEMLAHPLGVGTGNVDDHLNYRLYRSNQRDLIPKSYNPHNQYIQTGIEIGLAGLGILLAILFFSLRLAWRQRNWILFTAVSSLAFNALFESMFQRSSGIVFFTLLMCVMAVYPTTREKPSEHAA